MYEKITLFIFLAVFFVSCSKRSDINTSDAETSPVSLNAGPSNTANLLPEEEEKKKYAERICYIVNDPTSLGTECQVPGSCKSYECNASYASSIKTKLMTEQIRHYAALDAEALLNTGLIDVEDVERFKTFIGKALLDRNKLLPSK